MSFNEFFFQIFPTKIRYFCILSIFRTSKIKFLHSKVYFCSSVNPLFQEVEEHKKTVDYDSEPRDYIDAYLQEIRKREKDGNVGMS